MILEFGDFACSASADMRALFPRVPGSKAFVCETPSMTISQFNVSPASHNATDEGTFRKLGGHIGALLVREYVEKPRTAFPTLYQAGRHLQCYWLQCARSSPERLLG